MKKNLIAVVTLVLGFIFQPVSSVQAQVVTTQTAPSRTAVTTQTNTSAAVNTEIPSNVGFFFRDISQRFQLLFSFNATRDATLRLKFAEDNLKFVQLLTAASADEKAVEQAKRLAQKSEEFVAEVNKTESKWSDADPEAINNLVIQAGAYFVQAENVIEELNNMSDDAAWQNALGEVLSNLSKENTKTKQFLQTNFIKASGDQSLPEGVAPILENDRDSDGVEDTDENTLGLSTSDFDTDRDGLSDSVELERFGTDPTNADTDGDGFRDGLEILKGFNPVGDGNFSTTTIKNNGFVFVKAKMTLPNLSPTTLKFLQDASQGKKLERYKGN